MLFILQIAQLLSAIAAIGLILIQHGKGADMGATFGSGSSGSLFGASGSANFQSRTTAILITIFLSSTLALAYFGHTPKANLANEKSKLEEVLEQQNSTLPAANSELPTDSTSELPSNNTTELPISSQATSNEPATEAASTNTDTKVEEKTQPATN